MGEASREDDRTRAAAIPEWARLTPDLLGALSPDARDDLLDALEEWGDPAYLLEVVEFLRDVHGPLLFLLDRQARALLAADLPARALDVVERRQRRSASAAAQAIEARALLALSRPKQAHAVAQELVQSDLRSATPLREAAEVLAALNDHAQADAALEKWLTAHPTHLPATLTAARVAFAAGDASRALALADRLGPGVPTDLASVDLKQLAELLGRLGRVESQRAVELEVEHRRHVQWARLRLSLAPYAAVDPAQAPDHQALFRLLNGPESVPVSAGERRSLQIAAIRNFGFGELRGGQAETIACVMRGESVLTIMPTGAGKSLCYQLPALTLPRASLVISPLIALMKDQVEGLPAAARPRATFINSTIDEAEYAQRMRGIAEGRYKLIYAAPERLRQRAFLRTLRTIGLDLFVIDEAHCVSLWGHDFRPDYLFLAEARRELGSPTTLAMTATAPPRVRDEILDAMAPDGDSGVHGAWAGTGHGAEAPAPAAVSASVDAAARARVISMDVFRNNLHLSAIRFNNEEEKRHALLHFVTSTPGAGIVYVNTRQRATRLAADLRAAGVLAEAYHAGMEERSAIQERFMAGATRVVVATVAFGMGIDKADIRFIVHFHPARSLAGYYQEVGRAGRDGQRSQGVLFFSANDWANLRRWARADEFSIPFLVRVYAAIASQVGVEVGAHTETVTGAVDVRRMQQVLNADETAIRVAVSFLERADLLSRSFDVAQEMTLTLPRALPAAARADGGFRNLVRAVRLGPGQSGSFRMAAIAEALGLRLPDCEGALLDWEAKQYLTVRLARRAMSIALPPLFEGHEARLERLLTQSQALAQRRIDDMAGYATFDGCRHGYISAQFGSPPRARCDVCDNCTGERPDLPAPEVVEYLLPDDETILPVILDCVVSLPRPLGRTGLARVLGGRLDARFPAHEVRHHGALKGLGESEILEFIDDLIEQGWLRQSPRAGFTVLVPSAEARARAEAWLLEHPEEAIAPTTSAADSIADGAGEEATASADGNAQHADGNTQHADGNTQHEARGDAAGAASHDGPEWTTLQKALWRWRKRVAEDAGQPGYVILPNDVLFRIASERPATLDALGQLQGIGASRLERYGPAILDLVRLHPHEEDDERKLAQQAQQWAERREGADVARAAAQKPVSPAQERKIRIKLEEIRQRIAVSERLRQNEVASRALLGEIARTAPVTLPELEAIVGFRSSGLRDAGPQIVTFVAALRQEKG